MATTLEGLDTGFTAKKGSIKPIRKVLPEGEVPAVDVPTDKPTSFMWWIPWISIILPKNPAWFIATPFFAIKVTVAGGPLVKPDPFISPNIKWFLSVAGLSAWVLLKLIQLDVPDPPIVTGKQMDLVLQVDHQQQLL